MMLLMDEKNDEVINGMFGLLSKPSVLIIDDEKRIRDACSAMLQQDGYATDKASDVETGLDKLEKNHFDIILLDLMMPGISGLEALSKIRARHPGTVVIVITGYATLEYSIEAMKKGAFDFISKPFSPQELRAAVIKAIEQIQTLKDISSERSRMRVLINHLADGVMATDMNKQVAFINPAFLKMIDYHGDGATGKHVDDFIRYKIIGELIDKALNDDGNGYVKLTEELHIKNEENETEKVLQVSSVAFRDRPGRILGTVTVLNDITSLKMMDQLKSSFVSMVSHEIKSPLNSIQMQLNVLLDGLCGELNSKQRDVMRRILEKVKSLGRLSSELLDLSKIESGLICQDKESVDMGSILKEQVAFFSIKAEAKSIELTLNIAPQLPRIVVNPPSMEEVVSNLISNAIRYTPNGGKVMIDAFEKEGVLCMTFKDTGFGIPEEDTGRIFEKFYRVKNRDTRFIIGTGLGLSIVKSILQAHNGMIRVESKMGSGSIFYVYLPIVSEKEI